MRESKWAVRAFPSTILKNLAFTILKPNFITYNTPLYNTTYIKTLCFLPFHLNIVSLLFFNNFLFFLSPLYLSFLSLSFSQHRRCHTTNSHHKTHRPTTHQKPTTHTTTTTNKKRKKIIVERNLHIHIHSQPPTAAPPSPPPANPPPLAHHKPFPSKTKSQTHQNMPKSKPLYKPTTCKSEPKAWESDNHRSKLMRASGRANRRQRWPGDIATKE